MSAGPIVIILGPYPRRMESGVLDPPTDEAVTVTINGLNADPTVYDVCDALNQALNQTNGRADSVLFADLPAAE